MDWFRRLGDVLESMPAGTWGEWVGAIGSILAAGGALWLLKREGDDRRELQQAERRRGEAERRDQASRVYVAYSHGANWWRNDVTEHQTWSVRIVNGSAEVLNDLAILVEVTPRTTTASIVHKIERVLPGEEATFTFALQGPTSVKQPDAERGGWLLRGVEVLFDNSRGSWHISDSHALNLVSAADRKELSGEH